MTTPDPASGPHEARTGEFVALLTRHQPDIYLYIRSLSLSPDEAAEAVQETSMTLWEKRDAFTPGTNFRAWAFAIARHKLMTVRGRDRRARRGAFQLGDEVFAQLAQRAEATADLAHARIGALRHCLDSLGARDRQIIQRRYTDDSAGEDVARELGRPVRWVYKQVTRIRRALHDCVTRRLRSEGLT